MEKVDEVLHPLLGESLLLTGEGHSEGEGSRGERNSEGEEQIVAVIALAHVRLVQGLRVRVVRLVVVVVQLRAHLVEEGRRARRCMQPINALFSVTNHTSLNSLSTSVIAVENTNSWGP